MMHHETLLARAIKHHELHLRRVHSKKTSNQFTRIGFFIYSPPKWKARLDVGKICVTKKQKTATQIAFSRIFFLSLRLMYSSTIGPRLENDNVIMCIDPKELSLKRSYRFSLYTKAEYLPIGREIEPNEIEYNDYFSKVQMRRVKVRNIQKGKAREE